MKTANLTFLIIVLNLLALGINILNNADTESSVGPAQQTWTTVSEVATVSVGYDTPGVALTLRHAGRVEHFIIDIGDVILVEFIANSNTIEPTVTVGKGALLQTQHDSHSNHLLSTHAKIK